MGSQHLNLRTVTGFLPTTTLVPCVGLEGSTKVALGSVIHLHPEHEQQHQLQLGSHPGNFSQVQLCICLALVACGPIEAVQLVQKDLWI